MQFGGLRGDPAARSRWFVAPSSLASPTSTPPSSTATGSSTSFSQALRAGDGVTVVSKLNARSDPGGPFLMRLAQRSEELLASVEANLHTLRLDRVPVVNPRRMDGRQVCR